MPSKRAVISPTEPPSNFRHRSGRFALYSQEASNAKSDAKSDATPLVSEKGKSSMFPSLTDGDIEIFDSSLTEPSSSGEEEEGETEEDSERKGKASENKKDNSGNEEDEEVEWEDVFQATIEPFPSTNIPSSSSRIGGDLHLTLDTNRNEFSTGGKRKGVSAQERQIRLVTHCTHVQLLLFHGAIRNGWLCDPELHAILMSHLTPRIMKDIEKFQDRQGNGSDKTAVSKGVTDPILKLLGILIHWWKKKFTINKPGLRKNGYKTLQQFRDEREGEGKKFKFMNGSRGLDGEDGFTLIRDQGERVESLEEFRRLARECKGSRDIGAMLFTALLRALGLESRMIFSLQPLGFGFTKHENYMEVRNIGEENAEVPRKIVDRKGKRKTKAKGTSPSDEVVEVGEDVGDYDSASEGFLHKGLNSPRKPKEPNFDKNLPYPIFWTEVYSSASGKWITVESLVLTVLGSDLDLLEKFEPKGKRSTNSKQTIAYVIAYSANGAAKDVTVRYLAKNIFPGKTKGSRMPATSVSVYDYEGKIMGTHKRDWFYGVMRGYQTSEDLRTENEKKEDEELKGFISKEKIAMEQKESISYYKSNSNYVLERHLKRDEVVKPGKKHIKIFMAGKGKNSKEEKVYSKSDIVLCKTVENWWREGRVVREGQQALKRVKPRASTLNKKREIEDAQRSGEMVLEGLYSEEQTRLYSPPPVVDGKIPRNSFGNIDIYVPSMIPPGAIHLSLKGVGKVARKLGVSYAEAVTGFEFKSQRAVPYIEGIITATENEDLLRDAWRAGQEEMKRRADVRREKATLAMWRRFLVGLRIVRHLRDEYGDVEDSAMDANPLTQTSHQVTEEQLLGPIDEKEYGEDNEFGVEGDGFFYSQSKNYGGCFIRDDSVDGYEEFTRNDKNTIGGRGGLMGGDHGGTTNTRSPSDRSGVTRGQSTTLGKGSFAISSEYLPLQNVMSFRDMVAQNANQFSGELAESSSEPEVRELAVPSSATRSVYSAEKHITASTKVPRRPSSLRDRPSKPQSETEGAKPQPKTRIEVQIPIRATLARKAKIIKTIEVPVAKGVLNTQMGSDSKRKFAVKTKGGQSIYTTDDEEDLGGGETGETGERRKKRKVLRR